MSQVLATSRFPVPNILPNTMPMGDHGALAIRAGGKWYVWTGLEWHPQTTGLTGAEFYRHTKTRPPCNVEDGWAGIFPCNVYAQNWTQRDVRAAFKIFMDAHAHEYQVPDGQCFDPLKKARILKRMSDQRVEGAAQRTPVKRDNSLIFEAPKPMVARHVQLARR